MSQLPPPSDSPPPFLYPALDPPLQQEVALDFIGKRGSTIGATKETRVQYARELLQKELLPHIGMEEFCETKKASFGCACVRVCWEGGCCGAAGGGAGCGGLLAWAALALSNCLSSPRIASHCPLTALSLFSNQAYFFGYVVHRLLLVSLGRREEDDRDHYGNKRLDLGGPLLANLFRQLFRQERSFSSGRW